MKTPFKLSSPIFYGTTGLMVTVCVICFVNALSWLNKPFPGFMTYKFPRVASMNLREWPGTQAGLKLMDRIITADGKPIQKGSDLLVITREQPLGTQIRYSVESEGEIREFKVSTRQFRFYDFFQVFLIPFTGGIILFCLGFTVCVLKPNRATSWVFFLACLFEGLYMVTGFEIMSTYSVVYVHYAVVPIMMAPLFHFGLIFPEKKMIVSRHPWLEYLVYVPAGVLAIAFELSLLTSMGIVASGSLEKILNIKMTTAFTRAFTLLCVVGMLGLVLHSLIRSPSSIARQRARIIIFGVGLAFLPPGLIMASVYFLKVYFPWNFLALFVLCYPASIAYSIVKHNLFDADTIIKRTVGYIVLTAIVIGIYVAGSLSLNVLISQYHLAQLQAFPLILTLLILLIFNPLRNRLQSFVDKIFFRQEYNHRAILDEIGGAITSLLDLSEILRRMVRTLVEGMFIDTSSVMLLNSAGEYQVYLSEGEMKSALEEVTFKKDEPLVQVIEKQRKPLTKYDVFEDPKYEAFRVDCSRNFETLHAVLIVPLVFRDEVIGLVNLGEKKSGKVYNREDIDLLRNIAKQGALAVENAKLHQAKIEAIEQSKAELEQLNKAKMRALDHFSHEIKTPLCLVQAQIHLLKRKAEAQPHPILKEQFFKITERNLGRISEIQQTTEKIIFSHRELEKGPSIADVDTQQLASAEPIPCVSLCENLLEQAKKKAAHRQLSYYLQGDKSIAANIVDTVFEDVITGLLKNAIENTPDGGAVGITLGHNDGWVDLTVRDSGIGVSEENLGRLFEGLFHTVDTHLYRSKKPYDFGAGGKGLDLLWMKVYSQRFGFHISVSSKRCPYLPTDSDLCPGSISECSHCRTSEDCSAMSGSAFCASFPVNEPKLTDPT